MKTLLAYNVPKGMLKRFEMVQGIQDKLFPQAAEYDRLVVSAEKVSVPGMISVVCDRFDQCVAAARNMAIEQAKAGGYDFVVLMDVDSVLLEYVQPYSDGFTLSWTFQSTEDEVRSGKFDLEDKTRWNGCGCFILPLAAFDCRFCEGFKGHGCEDTDFHHNVMVPAGIKSMHWRTKMLHVAHPYRKRDAEHNFVLLAARLARFHPDIEPIRDWADPGLMGLVTAYRRILNVPDALEQLVHGSA